MAAVLYCLQTSANPGPDLRLALKAIFKALISKLFPIRDRHWSNWPKFDCLILKFPWTGTGLLFNALAVENKVKCIFYNFFTDLQVIAVDQFEHQVGKETALMRKSPSECSHILQLSLSIVLSALAVLALAILAAVFYYHRRKPIQRLQRAR